MLRLKITGASHDKKTELAKTLIDALNKQRISVLLREDGHTESYLARQRMGFRRIPAHIEIIINYGE